MRVTLIILFSLLYQLSFCQAADTLKVEYDIIESKPIAIIKLSVNFRDSVSEKEGPFISQTSSYSKPPESGLDVTCSNLASQIRLNKKVEIYVDRPQYINDIIKLIPSPENQAKAIRIYNNEFQKQAIIPDISEFKSTIKGKIKHEINLTINIPLIVKSDTQLIIEPFPIKFRKYNYVAQRVTISLKK